MKLGPKLILMVTLLDILVTWIITRSLDYVAGRLRKRFRLRLSKSLLNKLWQKVVLHMNHLIVEFYLGDNTYLTIMSKSELSREIYVRTPLVRHRRMHKDGIIREPCRSCKVIESNRDTLLKFVSDPKLYPPFSFPKKP